VIENEHREWIAVHRRPFQARTPALKCCARIAAEAHWPQQQCAYNTSKARAPFNEGLDEGPVSEGGGVNYHDACRVAFLKRMRDPMVVLPPQEEPGRCHDRAVSLLRQTRTVGEKRGGG
jgi:hypothetical protein